MRDVHLHRASNLLAIATASTPKMSSRVDLTYPPSAHLSPPGVQSRAEPAHPISSQPSAKPAMSPVPSKAGEPSGEAQRIRGGCVPCPDGSICYIIPIPCICC
ncbi:hypothetical protein BD414DRAFT_237013 [Trametes punicea]|nr:hypothetical protein BD414DRAFT_237013 [Trametes punicea]